MDGRAQRALVLDGDNRGAGPPGQRPAGAAGQAQAGITLATAIMYLHILAIVAIFNLALARALLLPLCALSTAGFVFCAVQYRWHAGADKQSAQAMHLATSANPLELGAAAIFALPFVAVSVATVLVKSQLGISGIYALAAIVGISDIDPFVLNLAQGGVAGVENAALAAAILIAASSNNILKAAFAAGLTVSAAALVALAGAGFAAAYGLTMARCAAKRPSADRLIALRG